MMCAQPRRLGCRAARLCRHGAIGLAYQTLNLKIPGSSPGGGSGNYALNVMRTNTSISLFKLKIIGSNPISSTLLSAEGEVGEKLNWKAKHCKFAYSLLWRM
jgi:hypothetical protein